MNERFYLALLELLRGVFGEIVDNYWFDFRVFINLGFALLFGISIFAVFYFTHRKISVSRSFAFTLVLLSPIAAMVSVIVSNDIVLAVGMLGALSIIRFRHSMKESDNLVYVFWAVTAGISCGFSYVVITFAWCALAAAAALAIHFIGKHRSYAALTVKTRGKAEGIEDVLREFSLDYELKYQNANDTSDMLFELKHKKGAKGLSGSALCDRLMQLDGVSSVNFVEV